MTHFYTLSYTSAREIATFFHTWSLKKSYPFRAEPPHIGSYVELKRVISDLRNEHTYLMHAHASLYTDVPPRLFKKLNEFILIRSIRGVLNQTL